jgi:hypothetical protein
MGTSIKDLKELMLQVARKNPPVNYTLSQAENALRKELRALAPDYNAFRRNKLTIYELMQSVVDEVLPNRVIDAMGEFAEIKNFAQGTKPIFKKKLGKNRGKSFVTRVGLSGIYETFRLDSTSLEVPTQAHGGAAVVEFERFLDGLESLDDILSIIQEGLEDDIYEEVQNALITSITNMPTPNVYSGSSFMGDQMNSLISVAKAYGSNANIICTSEFASTITTSGGFYGSNGWSMTEQEELRDRGYIGKFKGASVLTLPQSFTDDTNATKVLNPAYAYIIPTGGDKDAKIVKIALEGDTIIDDFQNADRSMEIQVYKKFGAAVLYTNYYCIYYNSALDPSAGS